MSEEFVRHAFGKGDVCGAVLYDAEIVSYTWVAFTPTHESDGVYVEFAGNYRYSYKGLTLPEFRGRHLRRYYNRFSDAYCVLKAVHTP